MTGPDARPLLLVTTGTDHHPFDRLVDWIESWLLGGGAARVRALVQYSSARVPRCEGGIAYLEHDALQSAIAEAAVVVCHAGATVTECRQKGIVPIVVPRLRALGEVVDDHQVPFARRLAQDGLVVCCETEQELHTALDVALDLPGSLRSDPQQADQQRRTAIGRAGTFLDALVQSRTSEVSGRDGPVVAYLAGLGRSGSTLLERLLDAVPGVTALGELTHMWERGLRDDERCGCGERFRACPFWREVGDKAFGGWDQLDLDDVLLARARVDRTRHLPELASNVLARPTRRALVDYMLLNRAVHAAAAAVTGAQVVVDSSKRASLAHALHRGGARVRVVHVVRDPRGVASSWAKRVPRPETDDPRDLMPVYSAWRSSWLWNAENLLLETLPRAVPRLRINYEDLVAEPQTTLKTVLAFLGLQPGPASFGFLSPAGADLAAGHLVAGNPMRFRTGLVPLRQDDGWRHDLPAQDRRVVAVVTSPLRGRYGYRTPPRRTTDA